MAIKTLQSAFVFFRMIFCKYVQRCHHYNISNIQVTLLLSHSNCASFRTTWCTQTVSNYFSYDPKVATKDLNLSKNSQLKESQVVVLYPIIDPIKGSVISN